MAVTINRQTVLNSIISRLRPVGVSLALLEAGAVLWLARLHDLWPVAVLVVLALEVGLIRAAGARGRRPWMRLVLARTTLILTGAAAALIIAAAPRLATQVAVAVLYAAGRAVAGGRRDAPDGGGPGSLAGLLVVSAVVFEAIFLMAAVWRIPDALTLMLVWGVAFSLAYSGLVLRSERSAGLLAGAWALVCVEVTWVLLRWLFTYTAPGGYLLVPQPVLILTALGYCFGNIYSSQRRGNLSRGRLTEYLLIGLILIAIVITGTPWRGSL